VRSAAAAVEQLESRIALSVALGLVPIGSQPQGPLTGRVVYTSAGHGWQWNNTLERWATDRPNLLSMVEDFGNQDQMTLYAEYLFQAGATVVPMRPVGRQLNEVVLDNDSPDVVWSGSWSVNTAGPRWFDEDYGAVTDGAKYRFATVNATRETAAATYAPTIPRTGLYPVYAWAASSSNRTNQLYVINHTGGSTEVRVDHRKVGNGWVWLGSWTPRSVMLAQDERHPDAKLFLAIYLHNVHYLVWSAPSTGNSPAGPQVRCTRHPRPQRGPPYPHLLNDIPQQGKFYFWGRCSTASILLRERLPASRIGSCLRRQAPTG
jgi:hypothetical protein